jgi:hypothetical protein
VRPGQPGRREKWDLQDRKVQLERKGHRGQRDLRVNKEFRDRRENRELRVYRDQPGLPDRRGR